MTSEVRRKSQQRATSFPGFSPNRLYRATGWRESPGTRLSKELGTTGVLFDTPERSFSAMRRVKTDMRSAMGEERLSGLALLHTYRDWIIGTDKVV